MASAANTQHFLVTTTGQGVVCKMESCERRNGNGCATAQW